jgi:hypothetical protein
MKSTFFIFLGVIITLVCSIKIKKTKEDCIYMGVGLDCRPSNDWIIDENHKPEFIPMIDSPFQNYE